MKITVQLKWRSKEREVGGRLLTCENIKTKNMEFIE